MDSVPVKTEKRARRGFWERVRAFFGVGPVRKDYTVSRFAHMIEDMDRRDAEYPRAKKAVEMCDEAIGIISSRVSMIEQLKDAEKILLELNCYEDMTEEDAKELKGLQTRLKSLTRDKSDLKSQIAVFDPNLARLSTLEEDAKAIQPEIKNAEQRQRLFRHDIHALRGEKSDLEYEQESLMRGERIMRRFMTGVLIFFSVCVTVLGISAMASGTAITAPVSILTILVIVITALLIGFRRKFAYELEMNIKKQRKAVEMLNKKNAVFAHYTNFLNFTYKKYRIRNSEMLKKRLKEYDHYRHLTRRYDALRKLGDETERDLNKLLIRLKIPVSVLPLDNFARVFNLDEKLDMHKNAIARKNSVEKNLRQLDERQAQIWDRLADLNRIDGGAVDRIIKSYMEEAGRIILNPAYISDASGE